MMVTDECCALKCSEFYNVSTLIMFDEYCQHTDLRLNNVLCFYRGEPDIKSRLIKLFHAVS